MQYQCSVDVLGYSAAENALELRALILSANAVTVTVKPADDFALDIYTLKQWKAK